MRLLNILQRFSDSGKSSLGLLFLGEPGRLSFCSYTLEDEARALKVKGETRIPAGYYELKLRKDESPLTKKYRDRFPWFTWHIQVMDVPGFEYVYIHIGNTEQDTDACILLGDGANNNTVKDGFISGSVEAYERWYKKVSQHLLDGQAFIEIRDERELIQRVA